MENNLHIEICCFSLEEVIVANQFPIHRIELCISAAEGGLTPSFGLVKQALAHSKVPIRVMIRLRAGNFFYSPDEIQAMVHDIELLKELPIEGFVFGALTENESIDWNALRAIKKAAAYFPITFHRAFDRLEDTHDIPQLLFQEGVDTILTSGNAINVKEGLNQLNILKKHSPDEIIIQAGGGVQAYVVPSLLHAGINHIHLSIIEKQKIINPLMGSRPVFESYPGFEFIINTSRLEQILNLFH